MYVYLICFLPSTYLLSFGLDLVWNDMLAVEGMRLFEEEPVGE